jgi:hypothetical protein
VVLDDVASNEGAARAKTPPTDFFLYKNEFMKEL